MKIQLASDLHLEMRAGRGERFFDGFTNAGADVLVLAGDVTSTRFPGSLANSLADASWGWPHVIFIMGNHEAYGSSMSRSLREIKSACSLFSNVYFLDNSSVEIEGVRFFGGAGWFPDRTGERSYEHARQYMNDFNQISDVEPAAYRSNEEFRIRLAEQERDPDVVVTHHLPISACVTREFEGDPTNIFFVSDFDEQLRRTKLWLHGHTHRRVDFVKDGTRVVANPLGYPGEDSSGKFDPKLLIEVPR